MYLPIGHIVGDGIIQPDTVKVQAVCDYRPTTKKEVRTFLGLSGYYSRFSPQYSTIASPLTDLTKKSASNVISNGRLIVHDRAFQQLKSLLSTLPILASPDFNRPFLLQTDTSDRGIGAVLSQVDDNGIERPVAY